MDIYKTLEIVGTLCSILYLWLLIKENIWCWIFGILASIISIVLLTHVTLYAEAILAVYYVIIGVYGWWKWQQKDLYKVQIIQWSWKPQLWTVLIGGICGLGLSRILIAYTDATNPLADAMITAFSFLASYKEARKVLSGWWYWIVLNGISIFLYFDRGLQYYAYLSIAYTVMSGWGYINWYRKYRLQQVQK
jgi:nicotinamide mononucleotide transporter